VHKGDKKSQLREERQVWKAAGLGCVAHEIGTLSMSEDPERGVVDANLKFHKLRNLYACDMSVIPVSAPANPSLTLVALALRLADHLVESSPPCA
jgi:choline dehydrogenase-like flavoprotein